MNSPIVSDVTAFDVRGDWGRLHLGDSANVLKSLQDNSIDAIVTDPPAGIAFMGKKWDADKGGRLAWISWLAEILRECRRVLKPGGHALVWALPRTSHWTATALEEAGFELRERITHIFSTGFPKNHDVSKAIDKAAGAVREVVGKKSLSGNAAYIAGETNALYSSTERAHGRDLTTGKKEIDLTAPATPEAQRYQGFGTALKPSVEDYFLARKPLAGTVAANVLEWGCGALNINGSRIPLQGEESPSVQRRKRAAPGISVSASRWKSTARSPGYNAPHPGEKLGRWPANLILSHSPDCSEDTCVDGCPVRILGEQSGFSKSPIDGGVVTKTEKAGWKETKGMHTPGRSHRIIGKGDTGTAARYFLNLRPDPPFFYCPKASVRDRNEGLAEFPDVLPHEITGRGRGSAGQMTPYAGASGDSPRKNTHPTVKSTKLMAYLCRLVTPPGGLILDPFLGSGSTGVAALREGFRFVGIEKEEEYFEIAKARIENEAPDEETETTEEQGPWKQLEMF